MTDLTGLLFPVVDLVAWCELHKLGMDPIECPHCQRMLLPDRPIATKEWRGYTYAECCDNTPILVGAADPAERERDRQFASTLIQHLGGEG